MFNVYPEDEYGLFDAPQVNTIQLPTQPPDLSKADVLRVAVIFSGYGMAAADYFRIAPVNTTALQASVVLTTQNATLAFSWKDYGPWVQSGWRVDGVGAGFLTITAIRLLNNPALRGFPDLFAQRTSLGIYDGAALHRDSRRGRPRSPARRLTPFQERLLRWRAPQLFPSGG